MPTVTDSMFKSVLIGIIFLTLMTVFNILFIGGQIGDTSQLSLDDIVSQSWDIFTQPELLIINAVLGAIGLFIALIVARELLPA